MKTIRVATTDDVDQALARLAMLERWELRAKGTAEKGIGRIKDRLKAILKPLKAEFKGLREKLERWTFAHPGELQEKTLVLPHGAVRLYKTPDAIASDLSDDEIVERLKRAGLTEYVRKKEEPNRERMHELDEATLKKVGCRFESHDEFQWRLADETEWR